MISLLLFLLGEVMTCLDDFDRSDVSPLKGAVAER